MINSFRLFVSTVGILSVAHGAWAHAFLDHAEPAVGSKVHGSPAIVKIWFTEKVESALCKLQVFDASGQEVDKRDPASDAGNPVLLSVTLPSLKPGKYKVVWRAVAVDTHVTNGDFKFEVLP
jgi:methionine-rich copper-binding protein CopC